MLSLRIRTLAELKILLWFCEREIQELVPILYLTKISKEALWAHCNTYECNGGKTLKRVGWEPF